MGFRNLRRANCNSLSPRPGGLAGPARGTGVGDTMCQAGRRGPREAALAFPAPSVRCLTCLALFPHPSDEGI